MGNTYTSLFVHFVFGVIERQPLLKKEIDDDVYSYMAGIIKKFGHKPYIINGVEDHVHVFVSMSPTQSVSDLARMIKSNTAKFINDNKLMASKFNWQKGFGAFTYGKSQTQNVIEYIMKQKEHHQKKTFNDEYLEILKKFDVDYNEEYLF